LRELDFLWRGPLFWCPKFPTSGIWVDVVIEDSLLIEVLALSRYLRKWSSDLFQNLFVKLLTIFMFKKTTNSPSIAV
jgi:hypothetical protein